MTRSVRNRASLPRIMPAKRHRTQFQYRPTTTKVAPGTVDHDDVLNIGTNDHTALDAHVADATIHFPDTSPDSLDDLSDVTLTTPTTGGVLYKSAGDWVDTDQIIIDPTGSVILNHNGSRALETTTSGINIVDIDGGGTTPVLNLLQDDDTVNFRLFASPTSTVMHTLEEGQNYVWRGTPTGGGLYTTMIADPDSDVALYHTNTDSIRTLKTGLQVLEGDNSNEPEIQFATNATTHQGTVGANHAGSYFYIRAEPNSDHIRVEAHSSGGVLRSLVTGDPDDSVSTYHKGVLATETDDFGFNVLPSSTATNPKLMLQDSSKVDRVQIYGTPTTTGVRSELDSGVILLEGYNASTVLKDILRGDPDGTTIIYGAGTANIEAGATTLGFYGTTPVAQSSAYTRDATVVEDRTLLQSSAATATNNNNVLAALIADLQALGLIG